MGSNCTSQTDWIDELKIKVQKTSPLGWSLVYTIIHFWQYLAIFSLFWFFLAHFWVDTRNVWWTSRWHWSGTSNWRCFIVIFGCFWWFLSLFYGIFGHFVCFLAYFLQYKTGFGLKFFFFEIHLKSRFDGQDYSPPRGLM